MKQLIKRLFSLALVLAMFSSSLMAVEVSADYEVVLNCPILYQYNYTTSYWVANAGKYDNVSSSGCGHTSSAMVVNYYFPGQASPDEMFRWTINAGLYYGMGSDHGHISQMVGRWGLSATWTADANAAADAILQGKPIVYNVGPSEFTRSGHYMVLDGCKLVGGVRYFRVLDPNSSSRTRKWYSVSYLDSIKQFHGASFCIVGPGKTGWQLIDGSWCYKKSDGSWATGWLKEGDYWYYLDSVGWMLTGWKQVDGSWYYFDKTSGKMQTGWFDDGGTWYYLDKTSGRMQTGWLKDGSTWYYLDEESGKMQKGWQKIDNIWYYFGDGGGMKTGWQTIEGDKYYFNTSGRMQTGLQTISESKYYFNTSGRMQTGRQTIDGAEYYFDTNGVMLTGMQVIDGVDYYFGEDGAMTIGWVNVDGEYQYFDKEAGKQANWQSYSENSVKLLERVTRGTSTENLTQQFENVDWSLFGQDGNQITDTAVIATGYVIKFFDIAGSLMESKAISVTGDINGDGSATASDCLMQQSYLQSSTALDGVFLLAADYDGNGSVTAADFLSLTTDIINGN